MARTHNPILELYAATYNDKEFTSANHLSNALMSESEWLSPMVTHAFGSSADYGKRNFPLMFSTEGMGKVKSISSTDLSYKIAVLGKPKKTSMIAVTHPGSRVGRGHSEFKVRFKDREFYKSQSVYTPSRLECRVQFDPVKIGDTWEYTFKLNTNSSSAYVPSTDLQAGKLWGRGIAKVGKERSKGVESRSYTPFSTTNQISVVRDSYNIAGNVANKVMVLEIHANGKKFKYWTQWELFQKQLAWKEKCESDLWYSTYNKDADGRINLEDTDSGEVVTSGAGALQQIPNEDQYSILSTSKLEKLITDIFFNASDSDKVNVEIYTGTGGTREAQRAMASAVAGSGFTLVDSNIVKRNSNGNLTYGAYFDTYMHRDGQTVTFKKLPLMDHGVMAAISPAHPTEGLPLESYNMYVIDNSTVEGEQNIQYISEKGREDINFMVAGGAKIPGVEAMPMFRASSLDASSIEWIKTQGIELKRPTNSFKLFNSMQQ